MEKEFQRTPIKSQQGFTLIELMISIVIMGILASLAVPSFNVFVANNRQTTQINELITAISLARSEAVKRNSSVTICKSDDAATCAGNWTDGWLVYNDLNGDGAVDAGENILRIYGALQTGSTLTFGNNNRITYTAQGIAAGFNGTFVLCDSRDNSTDASHAKGLVISNTGRSRLAVDSNDSGTIVDGGGGDVTCP